jgi:hypothetical protein
MDALKFKIGDRVDRINSSCMVSGFVTGISDETNMTYVHWWQHGRSAIPTDQLVLSKVIKEYLKSWTPR